jgi:hypothetical protein
MITVELYGRSNNVLNRMSRKVYTVVMVNHDGLPACHGSGQPVNGLPAYADFGLAAHLAEEGVSVYTTDHVRFSKIILMKSVALK